MSEGTRYPLSERVLKQIENDFTYHAPKGSQPERYIAIRNAAKDFATLIAQCVPEGRDQSLALTHLKLAVMLANSGIAAGE